MAGGTIGGIGGRNEVAEQARRLAVTERREKLWKVQTEEPQDASEREIAEHERQERDLLRIDAESNEASAPQGQTCRRCGALIITGQHVRLRADGGWAHEECPPMG
jgi:hypothetical protein